MGYNVLSLTNLKRGLPLWYRQEGRPWLSSATGRWVKRIACCLAWFALLELAYAGGKGLFVMAPSLFNEGLANAVIELPWRPTLDTLPPSLFLMALGGAGEAVLGWVLYSAFKVLHRICYLGSLLEPENVGDLF